MYSERFQQFIEMWQKDFAIERSMNEKVCIDRDGNPIPWYTYPAIEYLSQFDYSQKKIFEFGTGYSSMYWAKRAQKVISIEDKPEWFEKFQKEFSAVKALATGGMVILDDSDRINTSLEYFNAVKALKDANLLQVDFYGFCPMNNYTKTTSVFFSRDFNFASKYEVQPINGLGNIWSMSRKERKQFFHAQDYPLKEEDNK